jgi:hypothetical protein
MIASTISHSTIQARKTSRGTRVKGFRSNSPAIQSSTWLKVEPPERSAQYSSKKSDRTRSGKVAVGMLWRVVMRRNSSEPVRTSGLLQTSAGLGSPFAVRSVTVSHAA